MEINKFNESLNSLDLSKEKQQALVSIIELKVEYEMEKLLQKLDADIKIREKQLESEKEIRKQEIKCIREEYRSETRIIKWLFVVIVGLLGLIIKILISR